MRRDVRVDEPPDVGEDAGLVDGEGVDLDGELVVAALDEDDAEDALDPGSE